MASGVLAYRKKTAVYYLTLILRNGLQGTLELAWDGAPETPSIFQIVTEQSRPLTGSGQARSQTA